MIEIHPIAIADEIAPGADLAEILGRALKTMGLADIGPKDVLVVTQKIVSKAENRFVDLDGVTPGAEAMRLAGITGKDPRLVEVVLAESTDVVRAAPYVLITRHRSGHVMANAGIDRSNIGAGHENCVLLLPENADAAAESLRGGLASLFAQPPAVVISDSFGRPWRNGVTCVAIGASGLPSLIDRRGELDRDGRPLEVTQIALGDMIASAAGLAMGEGAEGVPAVLMRGAPWSGASIPASALVRPLEQDLFR